MHIKKKNIKSVTKPVSPKPSNNNQKTIVMTDKNIMASLSVIEDKLAKIIEKINTNK